MQLEALINRLHVETRIKEGAENLLQVLEAEPVPDGKELAKQVTSELQSSKLKIANINRRLDEIRDSMPGAQSHRTSDYSLVNLLTFRSFKWSQKTFKRQYLE